MITLHPTLILIQLLFAHASGCLLPPGVSGPNAIQPGVIVDFLDTSEEVDSTVCLPMRSADIRGIVVDGVVEVTMTQEFETFITGYWPPLLQTLSRYQFPLDEGAAVTAFRVEIGARVIEGVVKAKDEAKKEFDEAVESGKPAFLAEQTRPDIFEISCGNLPRSSVVRVVLVYVAPLLVLDTNTYRFVLPTKVAPRYSPRPQTNIPNLDPLLNDGVRISLGTLMSTPVTISSQTHQVQVIGITRTVTAVEVTDSNPLARDVVIDLKVASDVTPLPKVFIEKNLLNVNSMMVSWIPSVIQDVSADGSNIEFVFILDRSGSMGDFVGGSSKIVVLSKAMKNILNTLPGGALLNIVGFGTTFEFLFKEGSQLVSDTTSFNAALTYVNTLNANFGGTEMLAPLKSVLESQPIPTHQRVVFLISDGQVANAQEIIDYVGDNLGSSRVFTLGVGDSAGRNLLNGIARNGAGTSDYVNGDSDMAIVEAVSRQIDTAVGSPIQIKNVTFEGVSVIPAPHRRPIVFLGRRFLQYFIPDSTTEPTSAEIIVQQLGADDVRYIIPYKDFVQTSALFATTKVVEKIAARELIRDLEEGRSAFHDNGAKPSASVLKNEIVRLGVKYQIASSETSFIAIDNLGWTGVTVEAKNSNGGSNAGGGPTGFVGTLSPLPVGGPVFTICVAGSSELFVYEKGLTAIKNIKIGDMIASGNEKFSKVYAFGHRNEKANADFVSLQVEGQDRPLEISRDHMIFVSDHHAVPASTIRVGDMVILGTERCARVSKVASVRRTGLYAPFTESGTLIVNGLLVSSYVSLQEGSGWFAVGGFKLVPMHWLAHTFQAPRRMLCSMNFSMCQGEMYTNDGMATWVYGPFLMSKWFVSQNIIVMFILAGPTLVAALTLYVVEAMAMKCTMVIGVLVVIYLLMRKQHYRWKLKDT